MQDANASPTPDRIAADCSQALTSLPPEAAKWLKLHAIAPRRVVVSRKTDSSGAQEFWLVTDHTGSDDASFRIVFDESTGRYGIEGAILNSVSLFIGYRESLIEAVADVKFVR